MNGSMFDMPVRGSNNKFPSSSTAKCTSFQFSLPTPGGGGAKGSSFADASNGTAANEAQESAAGSNVFRSFTFSTPARGNTTAARTEREDTVMTDEDMSQIDDEESQYDDDDDDATSQFELDQNPAAPSAGTSSTPAFTMNFTPSRPSHTGSSNPPPNLSQGFNIQFSLPGGGATTSANNVSAVSKDYAMAGTDHDMADMPAGEDAFSHFSGKTGHTAQEQEAAGIEDDEGKCSQESDTSRATSHSAGSAYTCETRSVVAAVAPVRAPPANRADKSKQPLAAADSASVVGDANLPSEKEVDTAALARLAEEHEQLTSNVDSAVDKFMTVQNSMRSKLMNAEQEFSSISENAGSLQVNLAQSLVDLLTMKLQLSIRKVANHKLVSKLQEALAADSEKTAGEGMMTTVVEEHRGAPMQVAA